LDFLYRGSQCQQLDRLAMAEFGCVGFELMRRAGGAAFDLALQRFPAARRWLVCCGAGNNAGDGYVVAALARDAGMDVQVLELQTGLAGDALAARELARAAGVTMHPAQRPLPAADLVIDALLGTGARGAARPAYAALIEQINAQGAPVLAIDVPSGVDAETGAVPGAAIRAALTLTFIGRKLCLHTGPVLDYCGEVVFDDLGVPSRLYERLPGLPLLHFDARRWPGRGPNAYKHRFGHLLVAGGDHGMGGAPLLAAEAALRSGAGLVSVLTRAAHVAPILARRPEVMVANADDALARATLIERAGAIVVGPGLGRQAWGRALLADCLAAGKPLLVDADGLRLLPELLTEPRGDLVVTPHAGEAADLLGVTTAAVADDRLGSVQGLVGRYGGAAVLKGAGTLIADSSGAALCGHGNPGMASAGMGDLLSGCIGALLAAAEPLRSAAREGALLHSAAGDRAAARVGQRSLIATDLLPEMAALLAAT
jgi:NAD(P)H-hydrate epimerase